MLAVQAIFAKMRSAIQYEAKTSENYIYTYVYIHIYICSVRSYMLRPAVILLDLSRLTVGLLTGEHNNYLFIDEFIDLINGYD